MLTHLSWEQREAMESLDILNQRPDLLIQLMKVFGAAMSAPPAAAAVVGGGGGVGAVAHPL